MKSKIKALGIIVLSLIMVAGCGKEAVPYEETQVATAEEVVTEDASVVEEKYLLVKEEYNERVTYYSYTFDSENRITKRDGYFEGVLDSTAIYDENENIVEEYIGGELLYRYEYDGDKKIRTYYYKDGEMTGFTAFAEVAPNIYDSLHYEITQAHPEGFLSDVWTRYKLDEEGNVVFSATYNTSDTINGGSYTYKYDEHGNLTELAYHHIAWEDGTTYYTYVTLDEYLNS